MDSVVTFALVSLGLISVFGGIAHLLTGIGASAGREIERVYGQAFAELNQVPDSEPHQPSGPGALG